MKSLSGYDVSPDQVIAVRGRENPWAIRNPLDEARDLQWKALLELQNRQMDILFGLERRLGLLERTEPPEGSH